MNLLAYQGQGTKTRTPNVKLKRALIGYISGLYQSSPIDSRSSYKFTFSFLFSSFHMLNL